MVQYKCEYCGKNFIQKNDHTRHINRKRPCRPRPMNVLPDPEGSSSSQNSDLDQTSEPPSQNSTNYVSDLHQPSPEAGGPVPESSEAKKEKTYSCNSCHKVFARSDSLKRHLNGTCKVLKQQELEKESIYQQLLSKFEAIEKKNQELEKRVHRMERVNRLKSVHGTTNNNTTNNTNNNITNNNVQVAQLNQQVNIKVLAFQKEDLSHIGNELYPEILRRGFSSVESLVKYVHFDKNKPENHNIYISNMRDQYAIVFDGQDWRLERRDDVLQKLIDDKSSILSSKFDELIETLDEPTIRKFRRVLDEIDADHVANKMKKELRLLLYNSRRIPEHTRELLGLAPAPPVEEIEGTDPCEPDDS